MKRRNPSNDSTTIDSSNLNAFKKLRPDDERSTPSSSPTRSLHLVSSGSSSSTTTTTTQVGFPEDADRQLVTWLQHRQCGDKSPQLCQRHTDILKIVAQHATECVHDELQVCGLTLEMAKLVGLKMQTFGSYFIGVDSSTTDSDIDVLFIGSDYVQREVFFDRLYKSLALDSRVTSLKVFFFFHSFLLFVFFFFLSFFLSFFRFFGFEERG